MHEDLRATRPMRTNFRLPGRCALRLCAGKGTTTPVILNICELKNGRPCCHALRLDGMDLHGDDLGAPIENISARPRRPAGVMRRARPSRTRSIHFSSKHRLAKAAPTAPPICGRRSVQSRHGRQKTRRFARAPERSTAELRQEVQTGGRDFAGLVAEHNELALDQPLRKPDAEHTGDVVVARCGPAASFHRASTSAENAAVRSARRP